MRQLFVIYLYLLCLVAKTFATSTERFPLIWPRIESPEKDIIDTLLSKIALTLVTSLTATNLTSTLRNPGPFTVFAPTEAAFARLPVGTTSYLLKPENEEALRRLLQHHIIDGSNVLLSDNDLVEKLTTLANTNLTISYENGNPFVNGIPVSGKNMAASNGIIHLIDNVLIPQNANLAPSNNAPTSIIPASSIEIDTGNPTISNTVVPTSDELYATKLSTLPPTNIPHGNTKNWTVSPEPVATDIQTSSPPTVITVISPTLESPSLSTSYAPVFPEEEDNENLVNVTIVIVFDDSPEEIGWVIQDINDDTVIASREIGAYDSSLSIVVEIIALPAGKVYLFGIEDSAGDGLCCGGDQPGSYSIIINNKVVASGAGNFGSSEFASFSLTLS